MPKLPEWQGWVQRNTTSTLNFSGKDGFRMRCFSKQDCCICVVLTADRQKKTLFYVHSIRQHWPHCVDLSMIFSEAELFVVYALFQCIQL